MDRKTNEEIVGTEFAPAGSVSRSKARTSCLLGLLIPVMACPVRECWYMFRD